MFDATLLVVFIIAYFLRDFRWVWYLSPISCIVLAAVFFGCTIQRMRRAMLELMDTTCDEQTQRNIVKVLVGLYDHYDEFLEVKSRVNANQFLIDVFLRFRPETSYAEIEQFAQTASEKLREFHPDSVVSIVIRRD